MQRSPFFGGLAAVAVVLFCGAGCSVLVDPDPGALGGASPADAGTPASDVGTGPACSAGCDDGIACTEDRCVDGACRAIARDERCTAGERCNARLGCVVERCRRDAECDDGNVCNGMERCDPAVGDPSTGCSPGEALRCDDGVPCTVERCDPSAGCIRTPDDERCDDRIACTVDRCDPERGCQSEPDDARCDDGYCFIGALCRPGLGCVGGRERDCRDGNPCTDDVCDTEREMCRNEPRDDDGDGFPAARPGGGLVCEGGSDCDDRDPAIRPGAEERCNEQDDDCDGEVDEGAACALTADTCASAAPIVLTEDGVGIVRGNIGMFGDDYQPSCTDREGGADAVYFVDIERSGALDVIVDTEGSDFDTVLSVGLDRCDFVGGSGVCNDDQVFGTTLDSRVWIHRLPAGDLSPRRLYISVDTLRPDVRDQFALRVEVRAAAEDACPAPLDVSGGGTVLGFLAGVADARGERGTCQSPDAFLAQEAVFRFEPSDRSARFEARATFDPDLYVRSALCEDSRAERVCRLGRGGRSELELAAAATPHYVFVDGLRAGSGSYILDVQP